MKKSVEQLSVEVADGMIVIQQRDPMGNHDETIAITPEQVVQLIEWLRDAREQIKNPSGSAPKPGQPDGPDNF